MLRIHRGAFALAVASLAVASAALGACSQQGAYAGLQEGQRTRCEGLADAGARDQCLSGADQSYNQYQQDRAALK